MSNTAANPELEAILKTLLGDSFKVDEKIEESKESLREKAVEQLNIALQERKEKLLQEKDEIVKFLKESDKVFNLATIEENLKNIRGAFNDLVDNAKSMDNDTLNEFLINLGSVCSKEKNLRIKATEEIEQEIKNYWSIVNTLKVIDSIVF